MLDDQRELLSAFNARGVKYLVVGGHAVSLHAEPRGTKDLDVFVKADKENGEAVFQTLAEFGAPLAGMTSADFIDQPESVYQVGVEPKRIDILQKIDGVDFDEAWEQRLDAPIAPGLNAHFISRDHLIQNKLALGRYQDLADVERIRGAAKAERSKQS